MKRRLNIILKVVPALLLCLALGACGSGETYLDPGPAQSQPSSLYLKEGAIATDNWGYTGSAPTRIATPAQTEIVLKERTLLQDSNRVVVSGTTLTKVSFSSDITNLPEAAQASAPANFVCFVQVVVGSAASATPAYSVTIDAASLPAGQEVAINGYDPASRRWTRAQTAVVSNGRISFETTQFGLWGVFR